MKRYLILGLLITAVVGWFAFDLGHYLTLSAIKAEQAYLARMYADNPLLVMGVFFAAYVMLTALSVPGATILTLAAGALFGLTRGTVLVSFASSLGATLAFLASRFVLRDAVQARFAQRLRPINEGISRDGAFYLFSLRLVPVFPFFVVNLVMGLTPIRSWTFYWVSQVGMLLTTIVYVNAGTELARIDSIAGIASPALLGSFAALALLPWVGKWLMAVLRRRRIYARLSRPRRFEERNAAVLFDFPFWGTQSLTNLFGHGFWRCTGVSRRLF